MSTQLLSITVLATLISYSNAQVNVATATFSQENNGIEGTVTVIDGDLSIYLDISNLSISLLTDGEDCLQDGIKFHIHERWDYNDSNDRIGSDNCGRTVTGNHWDPWVACGSATDNDACLSDGGCVPGSTVLGDQGYDCSTSTFADNPYACEVGDWNGKYGLAFVEDNIVSFIASSPYEVSASDLKGLSVVFHCNAGARAFCAPFEITSEDVTAQRPTQVQS